jgi:hypothetical protein
MSASQIVGMTAAEAAEAIGCSVYAIWRGLRRKQLRTVGRPGLRRDRRIHPDDVEHFRALNATRERGRTTPVFGPRPPA